MLACAKVSSNITSFLLHTVNNDLLISNDEWGLLQDEIKTYLSQSEELDPQIAFELKLIIEKNETVNSLYLQYVKFVNLDTNRHSINMQALLLDKMYIEVTSIKELSIKMMLESQTQIKNALYIQSFSFILIAVFAVVFLLVSSNKIFGKIHKALAQLKEGLNRMGKADFTTHLQSFSDDEFREVAEHFNQMSENLKQITILKNEFKKQVNLRTQELQQLAETDTLTKLPNRRFLNRRMESDIASAKRMQQSLCMLMLDIDYFKNYNDFYGHDMGDVVLSKIAHAVSDTLPRATDSVSRFGGEEFVILLPSTDINGAKSLAERIHLAIKSLGIDHANSKISNKLTVSIGIAMLQGEQLNDVDLFKQADLALYQAKNNGRNQSQVYSSSE